MTTRTYSSPEAFKQALKQRLRSRALIVHPAPIAEEPLGFLAESFCHVLEPRANQKPVVDAGEQSGPALGRVDRHLHFPCEIRVHERLRAPLGEDMHQSLHRAEVGDAREIPDVLP